MGGEELDSLPLVVTERNRSRQGWLLLLLSLTAGALWLLPTITFLYLLIEVNSWRELVNYCNQLASHIRGAGS